MNGFRSATNPFARYFGAHRKAISLYLSLLVVCGGWLYKLMGLSKEATLASQSSVTQLLQHFLIVAALTWLSIYLLLFIGGEGFGSIGLGRSQWKGSLMFGALFGLALFLLQMFVISRLARRCFPNADAPSLAHWFRGSYAIPIWLVLVCMSGPLEESGRSFVLTRFERLCGRTGLFIGLILQTIMFGLGHLYQGKVGALTVGTVGLFYALIYLRRRSCWEAAIAHSTFNFAGVTIAFLNVRGAV